MSGENPRKVPPPVDSLAGEGLQAEEADWAAVAPRRVDPQQWERFEPCTEEIFMRSAGRSGRRRPQTPAPV